MPDGEGRDDLREVRGRAPCTREGAPSRARREEGSRQEEHEDEEQVVRAVCDVLYAEAHDPSEAGPLAPRRAVDRDGLVQKANAADDSGWFANTPRRQSLRIATSAM